jgi:hypothetical protein
LIPCLVAAAPDAVPVHRIPEGGLDSPRAGLPATAATWAAANGFKGASGSVLAVPAADGSIAAVLLGTGKAGDPNARRSSRASSPTCRPAPTGSRTPAPTKRSPFWASRCRATGSSAT